MNTVSVAGMLYHDGMNVQAEGSIHSNRLAFGRQVRGVVATVVGVLLTTVAAGLLIVYAYYGKDTHPEVLLSDPIAAAGGRHVGIFTTIGVVLWSAAAAVLLYGAALMHRVHGMTRVPRYLLLLGLFTLLLCLDDFYFIHEDIGVALAKMLGVADNQHAISSLEAPYFLIYVAFTGFLILRYRDIIRRAAFLLLLAAGICFAGSLVIDVGAHLFPGPITDHPKRLLVADIVEDLLKLAGIQLWLAYAVSTVTTEVLRVFRATPDVATARV